MNLAPLLFDLFCKRRDLPALRNPVVFRTLEEHAEVPVREAFRLPDDGTLADLADQPVPLLAPVGFADWYRDHVDPRGFSLRGSVNEELRKGTFKLTKLDSRKIQCTIVPPRRRALDPGEKLPARSGCWPTSPRPVRP